MGDCGSGRDLVRASLAHLPAVDRTAVAHPPAVDRTTTTAPEDAMTTRTALGTIPLTEMGVLVAGCPEPGCSAPAEVTNIVVLGSSDGRLAHARTRCANGHLFVLPTE